MNIKEEIGQRILVARKEKGLTRNALAALTDDLKPSRINNWERGDRTPGPEEIKQLAKALETSPAYLMCLTDEKQPKKIPGLGGLVPLLDYEQASDPEAFIQLIKNGEVEENFSFIPVSWDLSTRLGENAFALKVRDDSMDPELRLNDIIIIDPDFKLRPGNLVVAKLCNENEPIIRRYKQLAVSKGFDPFELSAENDNWGSIKIDRLEECIIIGPVICIIRYVAE